MGIIGYDEVAKRYRFVHFRAGDKLEDDGKTCQKLMEMTLARRQPAPTGAKP